MPRSHGNSGNLYLKLTVSRGDPDARVSTSATTRNAGTLELALCNVATPILSDRVPEGEVEVYVYSIKSFLISACPRCNLTSDTRSGTPGGRAGTTASPLLAWFSRAAGRWDWPVLGSSPGLKNTIFPSTTSQEPVRAD